MTVVKGGHMVIVYGRVGYKTENPVFPEARFSVYYADDRGLRPSTLLRAGQYMPMRADKEEEPITIYTPLNRMDYQWATVDPTDDETAWIISEYADKADTAGGSDTYRTVVGRVRP
jgi:hypothetical protein